MTSQQDPATPNDHPARNQDATPTDSGLRQEAPNGIAQAAAPPTAPSSPPTAPTPAPATGHQTRPPGAPPFGVSGPYGGPMVPGSAPYAPSSFRPIGLLLVLLGVILAFVSLTMTWNPGYTFSGNEFSAFAYANALIGDPAWTTTGVMLMIGLIIAVVAAVVSVAAALVHALTRSTSSAIGWVLLGFVIAGFVVSFATLLVYLGMEDFENVRPAVWVYGLSFIPVVVGGVGILSRKY